MQLDIAAVRRVVKVRAEGEGDRRRQAGQCAQTKHPREGVHRERPQDQVQHNVDFHPGHRSEEQERDHGWQIHPAGLGIADKRGARDLIGVPAGDVA